ncbi:MAG: hypothetical protein LW825_05595 [Candidatus Jidaibacter sp.]|nr:hypothetical protein [Candidatus Jidaibacter sp.]
MIFKFDTIDFLIKISRFNFGKFERAEFRKFLLMGLMFALIIGVYWTLRPLRDAIFIGLVDKMDLPYAKTLSVIVLLPLVISYTQALERLSWRKMLVFMPIIYSVCFMLMSIAITFAQDPAYPKAEMPLLTFVAVQALGYLCYILVESFGSLVVALFWAFSSDTTEPTSAKHGFPLVIAIGQIGGMILPYAVGGLPYRLGLYTDGLSMFIVSILIFCIVPLFKYFLRTTPKDLLVSFQEQNKINDELTKQEAPGFFSGFKLILAHKYLLGIFMVNFIYDFLVTIFDFNFKITASLHYTGVALTNYLSIYGSTVNAVSLLCLLLGISSITRFLGVRVSLVITPIVVSLALIGFLFLDSLSFLYGIMLASKAINYSLNGPTLKQLYIPVTREARFKAQAWIETFGSRTAKDGSSLINMLLKPLQSSFGEAAGKFYYLGITGILGFPLLALWFITAIYLGGKFTKAVEEKKLIC